MNFWGKRARLGFLGAIVLAVSACSSSQPPAEPSSTAATRDSFTNTWLADVSLDEKFSTLFESPEVVAAGQRLWAKLQADPSLQRSGASIIAQLTQSPQFAELARRLATEHPDWGEEEFGDHFVGAVDELSERPEYDEAFRRLVATPSSQAALQEWALSFTVGDKLALTLGEFFAEPDWRKIWQRRVGPTTDTAELVSRVDSYLVSERGAEDATAVGHAVLDDPRVSQMLAELLDSPLVTRVLLQRCRKLLESPDFQRDATAALLAVFSREPLEVQIRVLDEMLQAPPVQKMLEGVLLDLAGQPELHELVVTRMSAILRDLTDNQELKAQLSSQKI